MEKNHALLLIDVQKGFEEVEYWGGNRNNPEAEQRISEILGLWRSQDMPIIHIMHNSTLPQSPLFPGKEGNKLMDIVLPQQDEPLMTKNVNSAFIGTELEKYLNDRNIQHLVVCGFTTDHCISTSVRMGANLGFELVVVKDATVTFDRNFEGKHYPAAEIHNVHLASLQEEFAEVVSSEEVKKRYHAISTH